MQAEIGGNMPSVGAETACRETSLLAAHQDELEIARRITEIEMTLLKLRNHLMGDVEKRDPRGIDTDPPTAPGILNAICSIGSHNIRRLGEMQEFINNLCYTLGEGRDV